MGSTVSKQFSVTILIGIVCIAFSPTNWCSAVYEQNSRNAEPPNIILIMADDMGFSDIGCYGSEIETPVLDRLANNGVRFTQFYNTSRCCPTRAALLTGLYSHQAGIGLMTGDRGYDAYRGDLNRNCVTLAEALRPAGYRTYMAGKWHVTRHVSPNGNKQNWPIQRGFDRFYGTITGAGSYFDPATLCRGNKFVTPVNDKKYQPASYYYTDAINENAVTFIRDHFSDKTSRPFFLYVSYTSAHWPMHARPEEIEKYKGKYDAGFNKIRNQRYRKSIECGVIDSRWPISDADSNWDKHKNREWDIRNMEVYAAMVDRMDQGIGWIVSEVKKHDALDNTIIIYLQDNGGCAEGYGRRSNQDKMKDADYQPLGPEELQNKIWPPMQTRDGRPVHCGPEVVAGAEDTFVAYGRAWANVSNTPFRGYKHDAFEGGISTPFIFHWPNGIPNSRQNTINHYPCHLIDVMPTLLQASGARYPKTIAGQNIKPVEGVNLIPALSGEPIERASPLGFEHHGNLALRDGKWKIVSAYRKNQPTKWHLYNMETDRTELNDLSQENPELLRDLVAKWQSWADRVGVIQWPFEPKRKPGR
ncbi:MAG: arylsulfatase [Planctomycetota bacterium]